jgi:hypothetical protein
MSRLIVGGEVMHHTLRNDLLYPASQTGRTFTKSYNQTIPSYKGSEKKAVVDALQDVTKSDSAQVIILSGMVTPGLLQLASDPHHWHPSRADVQASHPWKRYA